MLFSQVQKKSEERFHSKCMGLIVCVVHKKCDDHALGNNFIDKILRRQKMENSNCFEKGLSIPRRNKQMLTKILLMIS